jgi:hypothetical protein
MAVARPCPVQFPIIENDFLMNEPEKPHLLFVQFLNDARPNSLVPRRHLKRQFSCFGRAIPMKFMKLIMPIRS